ncbi:conserved hypothetical protein [Anaeromyxobacter dehalogenans 2CP-1]|uniref:DUF2804 domain-containing protein n=1 Tax=Anaeromyxobacter dehalogenans (strain ATCC BAA-258 / DSM 21875 / 2CP-1) TaxID=455488 RepID=B8JF08_ANAD2|nr:DUF2804 domain-containing protein [Anaeromyxobacter dehalogenans]ACL64365.1 conserved hypothetical protein [Anaeromyxobacter dehalogenans 2CP-1]
MDLAPRPLPAAPAAILDAAGTPCLGAYHGTVASAALRPLAPPGLAGAVAHLARAKRWVYVFAAGERAALGLAVVEAGWFAGAFLWVLDRTAGRMLAERRGSGLPGVNARVEERPWGGATWRGGGLELRVTGAPGALRVEGAGRGGLALDLSLDAAGAPGPLTVIAPVPGAGPRLTEKRAGMAARGAVRLGGRSLPLDGGAGGADFTAGLLARRTDWRWAFGTGFAADGAALGFNLCAGFGLPPGDAAENALLAGDGPLALPAVAFAFDPARPLAPWRVESAGGAVRLAFRPEAVHREDVARGVVRTRFAQVAGTFEGVLPAPGGGALAVAGLPGVVEDHRAVW